MPRNMKYLSITAMKYALDDFRRDKDFAEEMDLLANPNGYEIIKAED